MLKKSHSKCSIPMRTRGWINPIAGPVKHSTNSTRNNVTGCTNVHHETLKNEYNARNKPNTMSVVVHG